MSSYSRLGFILVFIFISIGCSKQPNPNLEKKMNQKYDLLILLTLDSEIHNNYSKTSKYYSELYLSNSKVEYLKKAVSNSYKAKEFSQMEKLSTLGIENFLEEKRFFLTQYIVSLVSLEKFDLALKKSLELVREFPIALNYEIVANIYYAKGDFKNSVKYYESAYTLNKNENTVVRLSTILYTYLDKKDVALAYLETYLQNKECGSKVCNKLMLIYQEQGNVDGMLSILNKMYKYYKPNLDSQKTTNIIQKLILSLLEKQDINKAINFLEKYQFDNIKLLNLYYQNNQLQKALNLTRKLYKTTKDPKLLGRIAMFEFELAKDKQKVMKHVIANFELALSSGINNASYQNYYGYLLIDYNLDVKKGIRLVKQALKTTPNNIAYLDTLAWGYYKIKACKKAYKVMKKIISKVGLQDKDIADHWTIIKKCKKDK